MYDTYLFNLTHHVADVVVVLTVGANGELRQVSLWFCIVTDTGVATIAWEAPYDTRRPVPTNIDLLPPTSAIQHVTIHLASTTASGARRDSLPTLVDDVNHASCIRRTY